jgi:hypothetical protein
LGPTALPRIATPDAGGAEGVRTGELVALPRVQK